jgi:uncharacterized protein DUF3788
MKVLGKSGPLWSAFIDGVADTSGPVRQRWNFSGAKFGWSLRLMKGDRILTYVTPQKGRFLVGVVLGEKAVQAAARAQVHPTALKVIHDAPRYAEGRGIRITVASRRDLTVALQIAALK